YLVKQSPAQRLRLTHPEPLDIDLSPADRRAAVRLLLRAYDRAPSLDADRFFAELESQTQVPLQTRSLFMTWDQVRRMREGGMSIGAHTVTHPVLARLSDDEERRELVDAKRTIEEQAGTEVVGLAYPVGGKHTFSERTKRAAAAAGYQVAVSYYGGANP